MIYEKFLPTIDLNLDCGPHLSFNSLNFDLIIKFI